MTAGGAAVVIPSTSSGGTNSLGKGDPTTALLLAGAVVVGAAVGIGMVATEGARYDGWVAMNPDEPLYLTMPSAPQQAVPLSALTPELASQAEGASVYEGPQERFEKLGRAPLHRAGGTMTTAFHLAGVPQLGGGVRMGYGGYLHVGGNIANRVTLGLALSADGGTGARGSFLFATVGPEVQVFPIDYLGAYVGIAGAFRNTDIPQGTRADKGWLVRGGLVGEIPLTTRLTIQGRFGVARYDLPEPDKPMALEGLLGLAVY